MRILDTYCKAGGAGMGYHRAGFEVVGVDIEPQPNYPFTFVQADAVQYILAHGHEYDAIHASPPCQRYSEMQRMHNNRDKHPDLVAPTREALVRSGKLYVIENVVGSPLLRPFMLCGTMFGLGIAHHRLFETNIGICAPVPHTPHRGLYDRYHGGEMARGERVKMSKIMGIDWFMTRPEVRNAIPPAYTEYIGKELIRVLAQTVSHSTP